LLVSTESETGLPCTAEGCDSRIRHVLQMSSTEACNLPSKGIITKSASATHLMCADKKIPITDLAKAHEHHRHSSSCPVKLAVFTVNLLVGLLLSQLLPHWLAVGELEAAQFAVRLVTMWCLSYIMVHVGYEFDIDKARLRSYGADYLIAMTAAGFPWLFVALWFICVLPTPLPWQEALVAARFAAPTSAGILFSMLEAAGMKETWLFKKARVLAIFDDLDTILLMVPLKVLMIGLRWELSIDLALVIVCFAMIWRYLHALAIPCSWVATMGYATVITIFCEATHVLSANPSIDPHDVVETVHLEVLLPAFAIGCVVRSGHTSQIRDTRQPVDQQLLKRTNTFVSSLSRRPSIRRERVERDHSAFVNTVISALFMVFVGLSMPSLFSTPKADGGHRRLGSGASATTNASGSGGHGSVPDEIEQLAPVDLVFHVAVVSGLMILGKMLPLFCYRDEVSVATRLALCLGMCPRGEVGAGVIVISLTFGIEGPAITIAVICLAINLVASSGFIMMVKALVRSSEEDPLDISMQTDTSHTSPFGPDSPASSRDVSPMPMRGHSHLTANGNRVSQAPGQVQV